VYFSDLSISFAFFSSLRFASSYLRFSSSSLRFAFFSSRSASSFSRYFVIFSLSTLLTNLFSSLLCSSLMVLLYCMSSKLLALFKPADCARRLFSALDRQKQPASFLLEEKTV
jgi:hypothetical protein